MPHKKSSSFQAAIWLVRFPGALKGSERFSSSVLKRVTFAARVRPGSIVVASSSTLSSRPEGATAEAVVLVGSSTLEVEVDAP
jgi:hypothetical protein